MRILYLHQYFKTPESGGAIRSYYVGKALAERGHEVVMLTSWKESYHKTEVVDGMQVHYLPVPYDNSMGFWQRGNAFLKFLQLARLQLDKLVPADLVYATSTPLTIGLLALYAQRRYAIPYLFEVRDLWPEAPIQLGFLNNKLLIAALQKLEQQLYKKAAVVVALSPGMADGVRGRHSQALVHVAPNMADCQFFHPSDTPAALVEQWGLQGKFVVSYIGSAGVVNHLEFLLEAARACQEAQLPVCFLVAAEGARLPHIKQLAAPLKNLIFVPYGNKEQVSSYLAVSDAVYTSFAPKPVLETSSPNKFFDGLAAGKLSLVNTKGWLQQLVEENQCGFFAPPEEPTVFVERLRPYLQNPRLLQQAQANARRLAETRFSRQQITAQLVDLVEKLG